VQTVTLADVVVDVVRRNVAQPERAGELDQRLDARLVGEREVVLQLEKEGVAAEDGAKAVCGPPARGMASTNAGTSPLRQPESTMRPSACSGSQSKSTRGWPRGQERLARVSRRERLA
jgi:hypothetical protein